MRSDEALAAAFRAGDDQAFTELYVRWRAPLFAFAARMLGGSEPARDAVQDTFVALWEHRLEVGRLRSFRAWIFTAARNRCLSVLRQQRTRARLDTLVETDAPAAADAVEAPDEHAMRQVRAALLELPPEDREVLVLREYEGCSYGEIADITGTTVSAVKSRLFRARRVLAARLRPVLAEGGEP